MPNLPSWDRLLTVPNILCAIRLIMSPLLIWLAWLDQPYWCLALFVALLMTDWLDGMLARWLNQRTTFGARLDSAADVTFFLSLLVALILLKGQLMYQESIWIGIAVLSYGINLTASMLKFRRIPTYHTRLAKLSWGLVGIATIALFIEWSVWPLRIAMVSVVITNIEELAITLILPRRRADVPSVFRARHIRKLEDQNATAKTN